MSLKGYLAKLGFTTAAAGSAAVLAFSAGSDLDASNRTGWYADITTPGSEKYGIVVGGTETVNAQGSTLSTGQLAVLYTTPSTDPTNGALVVGGGVGIGGCAHIECAQAAGSGQRAGSLSTQGGIRAGFGLSEGIGSNPVLVCSQGSSLGDVVGVDTYTGIVTRRNVSDSNVTGHHTSLLGCIGGTDGISTTGRARLSGVMGLSYFDAFKESYSHLTGGYFLADSKTDRPQDFHITGAWVGIRTGNFRSNVANSRAVGLDSFVDVQDSQGDKGQQAYGVRSISAYTITSASAVSAANYGGYFQAVCNVTGAGSSVTNAYGIYATASGAVNNYAGWFEGHTYINGKLTVTGLIDPTGLQFDAVAANPGNALTLWVDSENADTLMFGATPVIGGDIGGSIATGQVAFGSGTDTIGGDALFAYNSELTTGGLTIGNTTPSTDTTTGALVVAGGVGIGGRVTCESISSPKGVETSQGFGAGALSSNTTGIRNTASGFWALYSNTTGAYNTASGYAALYSNTTGNSNTASGYAALFSNTTGDDNTASGLQALSGNTTGANNTASGYQALFSNTTGTNNTASGCQAGRYTNAGSAANAINDCVLLGYDTRVEGATDTNEIVIGSEARGNGSNTVTIGNDSIVGTHLRNAVITGTTPTAVASGEVKIGGGAVLVAGDVDIGGTTDSTSTTTGALVVGGGVGIDGSVHIGGDLNLTSLFGQGVLYMDEGVVSAIGIVPGLLYTQLVTASGATTDAPTLSGLNLNAQVSGLIDPPYSADSPILSIKGRFDDGFFDGTPGVEIGVELPTEDSQFSLFVRNAEDADDIILIEYQSGAYTTALAGDLRVGTNIEINQAGWAYYGSPSANGSWRFGRDGDNTVFQRRESDTWVTKMTVEA